MKFAKRKLTLLIFVLILFIGIGYWVFSIYKVNKSIEQLRSDDWKVREEATKRLTKFGKFAVGPLITALKDEDAEIRWRAARALGKTKEKRAIKPLAEALKDKDRRVRYRAVGALREIENLQAMQLLVNVLENEKDIDVQDRATQCLFLIERPVIPSLLSVLENTKNKDACLKALEIFELLGETGKIGVEDRNIITALFAMLKDKDPKIRDIVQKSLAKIGNPTIETLINTLKEENYYIRLEAVKLLGNSRDRRAIEPLINILNDKDKRIKYRALESLDKIGNIQVIEPIIPLLKDENLYIRAKAAELLGKTNDRRVVVPLVSVLNDTEYLVRTKVVESLGEIGDSHAIEPLISTFKDADLDMQIKISQALTMITKYDFGNNSEKWQKWWEENKEKYTTQQ